MDPRLHWQLHKVSFLLEKRADEALKKQLDIGFAQYKVLEVINQNSLTRQNTVAAMLDQTEASISRQIKILQNKGLIEVKNVMGNKRARELSLTKVGQDVVRQAAEVIMMSQAYILSGLNEIEQQQFLSFLDRLNARSKDS